eukprot:TRINITY_DN4583_c0_g1_i1.p1 TRINITY_DN4583_c0_g1~~TRINITY_DN4583_c0_g1_i1.p1  ORF type:complete len:185 (-),score=47.32 TRINITY_DN4583_c0_g1_i1:238-792(-)
MRSIAFSLCVLLALSGVVQSMNWIPYDRCDPRWKVLIHGEDFDCENPDYRPIPDGYRACIATFISVILTTYDMSCDAMPCSPDKLYEYGQKHQGGSSEMLKNLGISFDGNYYFGPEKVKQAINRDEITIINLKNDNDPCVLAISATDDGAQVLTSRGKVEFYPNSRIVDGANVIILDSPTSFLS